MSTKAIPYNAERYSPEVPAHLQIARIYAGTDTTDTTLSFHLADSTQQDSDGVFELFSFPANTFVKEVAVQTLTAVAGGSVIIGDGDDCDGYWTDTLLDPATTTAYPVPQSTQANAYRYGKDYTAADTIDLMTSANPSAGKLMIQVTYALEAVSDVL